MSAVGAVPPERWTYGAPLQEGDILPTWCHIHGVLSPHRYEPHGFHKLVCVECEKAETDATMAQVEKDGAQVE